jgi:hypothetical protein
VIHPSSVVRKWIVIIDYIRSRIKTYNFDPTFAFSFGPANGS